MFAAPLDNAMKEFNINTPARMAAFMAQVAHESSELRYTAELSSGVEYEHRKDLGNIKAGDGAFYKGRGLLQITGRANYQKCGAALVLNLLINPYQLEAPVGAARSAGWFWSERNLNALADINKFGMITLRINGGYNGIDQRLEYWLRARKVFGL